MIFWVFFLIFLMACGEKKHCTLVFSGDAVRHFTTIDPTKMVQLPRKEYVRLAPDQHAGEYYIDLLIDGQKVPVVADTGSSNLVVAEGEFKTVASQFLMTQFSVSYGSGHGIARAYEADVSLPCLVPVTAKQHLGVLAQNNNLPSILGLGYESIAFSKTPKTLFWDQLVQNYPEQFVDVFSTLLCGHRAGSAFTFGGPLPGVEQKDLVYVPIIDKSYYVVDANGFYVKDYVELGGQWQFRSGAKGFIGSFPEFRSRASGTPGRGLKTFLDTGATMNSFSSDIYYGALKVLKQVSAQKQLKIPEGFWEAKPGEALYALAISEETVKQLPTFVISVRGPQGNMVELDMWPAQYLKQLQSGRVTSSFRLASGDNILGQAFMEGYYVEHDRVSEPNRLGFLRSDGLCH